LADESLNDSNLTPMMRQYREHKTRHPAAVLLFRMGDFYEMFFEDAEKASKILEIALTSRDKAREAAVPMCGFPHHAAAAYISRLLAAGERVAVCDQMEDPRKAKGLVRREVTKVLTPGLTEEPGTLKAGENHFVVALAASGKTTGIAAFDLSTGDLLTTQTQETALAAQELRRLSPSEVLVPERTPADHFLRRILDPGAYVNEVDDWMADPRGCLETLKDLYSVQSLEGFGLSANSAMTVAVGVVLNYVRQARIETPAHIKPPRVYHLGAYMALDQTTLRNLEIFKNAKDGSSEGSLVALLDKTLTPMGARLLRQWIAYPLLDPEEIQRRSQTVAALVDDAAVRENIKSRLKNFGDLERIAGRISLRSAGPRDLIHLKTSIEHIPGLLQALTGVETELAAAVRSMDDLSYVAHAVASVIVDSPPPSLKDGGVIKAGYNQELDELRAMSTSSKEWIAGIESAEREKTGVGSLKVGYNRVFGYYIEVTNTHKSKIPTTYIRKQTLVNAERYITEELKEYELKVLNAHERIVELEEEIFQLLRSRLLEVIPRIQETSRHIAVLDAIFSLAEVAAHRNYVMPIVHEGDEIRIADGRHPVVERAESGETFVPNDVFMNRSTDQILIITGPNMAGKSTYMRQTALLTLMAQMGGFVAAREAYIGIVDRIFTRIGAADYLAFGQSTFMVEMNETADILHNASERSLVLLDEVGRGTSTFDGLSIAWAVAEHLHDRPGGGPRTLFATHYHELVDLALVKERVRIYNISVKEWGQRILFLRKIVPGGASRSYGVQVAKLAGIPDQVIDRANEILSNLEKEEIDPSGRPRISRKKRQLESNRPGAYQADLFGNLGDEVLRELGQVDPNAMTPLDALNLLADWKKRFL
jgi:DNA mismatch repair protein MutS